MGQRNLDIIARHPATDEAMVPFVRMLGHELRTGDALITRDVADMTDQIRRALGPGLTIRRLRVFGHGNEGIQSVGMLEHSQHFSDGSFRLHYMDSTKIVTCQITEQVHPDGQRDEIVRWTNETELRKLTAKFTDRSWVELHGCLVARGRRGRTFISQLAKLWNVTVKAGEILQHAGGGFEGRVSVARPDGSVEFQ